jgi:hypothetical protein
MPESPYLVTLAAPDNAPATIILPNGQHYTRDLDNSTGGLAATIKVWDHDVDACKAMGFRDPKEVKAAQQAQAQFWAEPATGPESAPPAQQSG